MTAKEYLSQVYKLDHKIHIMKLEVEEYNRLSLSIPSIDYSRERVDHTPSNESYYAKWIEKAIDKQAEINEKIKELEILKLEVSNEIDKLENENYRMILKYRYINSMTFPDIAKKIFLAESTVKRLHREAVESFVVPQIQKKK